MERGAAIAPGQRKTGKSVRPHPRHQPRPRRAGKAIPETAAILALGYLRLRAREAAAGAKIRCNSLEVEPAPEAPCARAVNARESVAAMEAG